MVVLELDNMLGSGANQYLSPDYFPPLSSPDSKAQCPLAMLAKTCSSIGNNEIGNSVGPAASRRKLSSSSESSLKSDSCDSNKESVNNNVKDSSSSNSFVNVGSNNHSNNSSRPKSSSSTSSLPATNQTPLKTNIYSPSAGGIKRSASPLPPSNGGSSSPAFKPYELTSSRHSEKHPETKKAKHSSSVSRSSASNSPKLKTVSPRLTPETKEPEKKPSTSSSTSAEPKSSSSDHGASPIIRSGLEVLQQGQFGSSAAAAEYNRKISALSSLSALGGYPHGFDHPAFRSPFPGPPHPHALGYPSHVSYSRVKSSSGAETIVPVCRDPGCYGCQFGGGSGSHGPAAAASASHMNGLMAAALAAGFHPGLASAGLSGMSGSSPSASSLGLVCPAGCVHQCDHPKLPVSSFPHLFGLGGLPSGSSPTHPSLAAAGYPSSLQSQYSINSDKPFVCNWVIGHNYCGKKFAGSQELLEHLKTHTSNTNASSSSSTSADLAAIQQHQLALASAAAGNPYSNPLFNGSLSPSMAAAAAAAHRTYPTPPLSPLSAARYHPYAAAVAASKANSLSPLVPPTSSVPVSLSSYYPYAAAAALYGQRLGPSVHP